MNEQLTNSDVIQLLKLWKVLFGTKFKSEDWNLDTVKVWTIALNDLKITPSEFALAQRRSLTLEWMPTAPADFLALARIKGEYPDCRQAYADAANQKYDHAVVYETARRIGMYELRSKTESAMYPHWSKVYESVCNEHRGGTSFEVVQSHRIEVKAAPTLSKEQTEHYMASIRALLKK